MSHSTCSLFRLPTTDIVIIDGNYTPFRRMNNQRSRVVIPCCVLSAWKLKIDVDMRKTWQDCHRIESLFTFLPNPLYLTSNDSYCSISHPRTKFSNRRFTFLIDKWPHLHIAECHHQIFIQSSQSVHVYRARRSYSRLHERLTSVSC